MNPARRPAVVGIRPTIDARRNGVREALEGKTLSLARSLAELISATLRAADGSFVRCIVPENTIGGNREAAAVDRRFRKEGVCCTITVTPSWCYPFETMDQDPLVPHAVWGFNGTERPGAVYLAALTSAHDQIGVPIFKIYGRDIQDIGDDSVPDDVAGEILRFVRASAAADAMRDTAYLSIGGVSMGIASSKVDDSFLRAYLGMRYEYVDMSEMQRRMERGILDTKELEKAEAWAMNHFKEMNDPNAEGKRRSEHDKKSDWTDSLKIALIIKDLMAGNEKLADSGFREESDGKYALAAGFQGQRQWTDFHITADVAEAVLNSPFDWNGIRPQYIVATENDHLNAVGMLFTNLLTGTSPIFADVRTYWSPCSIERISGYEPDSSSPLNNGFIYLTNSGSAALDGSCAAVRGDEHGMVPFWDFTENDAKACLEDAQWGAAKLWTFRGGGFSSAFTTRGGLPFTMLRINIVKGVGPVLQLAEGWSLDLPSELYASAVGRTDPTWPKTFFAPRITGKGPFRDVYAVMKHWNSNHAVLCFGHRGDDLMTLASLLRIPVSMHNVPEERVFRPTFWDHLGNVDSIASDHLACRALGPLYGPY